MPFNFSFPSLRVVHASAVNRFIQFPTLSVRDRRLPSGLLQDFSRSMFNRDLDGADAAASLRQQARDNAALYGSTLLRSIQPIFSTAFDLHRASYGGDPTAWDGDGLSTVYSAELTPARGHAVAVVSFEPHPRARAYIQDPNLVRYYLQSFPGLSAALSPAQYIELFRGDPGPDGTPDMVFQDIWPSVLDHNADLFRRGADLSGPHLLGSNSFIQPEVVARVSQGDTNMVSSLMVTTRVHSQDGVVPWTYVTHPDLPGVVICMSLHFGNNPIPGGDAINAAIAAPLFKTIFRRGTLRGALHDDIVQRFGADKAALGLLDRDVRSYFESRVRSIDWRINWDTAALSAMDTFGGALLKELRLIYGGDTISTVAVDTIQVVVDDAGYDRALTDGVQTTIADGYSGPPRIESSEPGAVAVPPGLTASSGDVTPNPRETPFLPSVQPFADRIQTAAEGLPWSDVLRGEIDELLRAEVQDALSKVANPTEQTVASLAAALDTPGLREAVRRSAGDLVLSSLATAKEFADTSAALGDDGAAALVSAVVSDPLWARMTTGDATSYLRTSMEAAIAGELQHRLEEASGEIQRRLANAADTLKSTRAELEAKRRALADIEAQLRQKPDDERLKEQRSELEAELSEIEARERDAEAAESRAEDDRRENEARSKDADDAGEKARRGADQRSGDVFPGEARALPKEAAA